jgi:hypothetical protein
VQVRRAGRQVLDGGEIERHLHPAGSGHGDLAGEVEAFHLARDSCRGEPAGDGQQERPAASHLLSRNSEDRDEVPTAGDVPDRREGASNEKLKEV